MEWTEKDVAGLEDLDKKKGKKTSETQDLPDEEEDDFEFDDEDIEEEEQPRPRKKETVNQDEQVLKAIFGEQIPEQFKGKKAADVRTYLQSVEDLNRQLVAAGGNPPKKEEEPEKLPEITEDDLKDPAMLTAKIEEINRVRSAPLQQGQLRLAATQNMISAPSFFPHWKEFEQEIQNELRKYDMAQLADPRTWQIAYQAALTSNTTKLTEVVTKKTAKRDPDFIETGSTVPAEDTDDAADPSKLSPMEKMVSNKLGVSPKAYAYMKARRAKAGA